jgi:hypothetical protein
MSAYENSLLIAIKLPREREKERGSTKLLLTYLSVGNTFQVITGKTLKPFLNNI